MRKSSPEELRKLRARSKEEERRKEEGAEKKISIRESPKQRKMKIIVVWVVAIAFVIMSAGALIGFGIGAITQDQRKKTGQQQQKPLSPAERMKKEMERNIKFYKEQIKENPKEVHNYKSLASIYAQTGNYEEALKYYNEALKIDPKDTFAMRGIAEVYIGQKKYGEARKKVNEIIVIEEKVNHPPLYLMLSLIDHEEKNLEGAIKNINKAIEIDPGNIRFYLILSRFYNEKGDKESAKKAIDRGLEVAKAMNDSRSEVMLKLMKQQLEAPEKAPEKRGSLPEPKFTVVPLRGGAQKGGAQSFPPTEGKVPQIPGKDKSAPPQPTIPGKEKQPAEPTIPGKDKQPMESDVKQPSGEKGVKPHSTE